MDIPLIHRFEAGYRAGAHEVCPACVVHVAYAPAPRPTRSAIPSRARRSAIGETPAGAPTCSSTPREPRDTASSRPRATWGSALIGVDADQYDEMPGTVLTSMIKRGDVAVFDAIAEVTRGELRGGLRSFGLAEHAVGYVDQGPPTAPTPSPPR